MSCIDLNAKVSGKGLLYRIAVRELILIIVVSGKTRCRKISQGSSIFIIYFKELFPAIRSNLLRRTPA